MKPPVPTRYDVTIIRRCMMFLCAIVAVWALQHFESFLVPTMIGLFLALVLTPVVSTLEAAGVPRALAAACVVLTVLFGLGAVIYAALPSYEDYLERGPEIARDIERKLKPIKDTAVEAGIVEEETGADEKAAPPSPVAGSADGNTEETVTEAIKPGQKFYTDLALSAPALFGNFLYVVFLTFFTIYDRRRLMRTALASQRSYRARAWLFRVIRDMRTKVASYLLLVTAINTMLGIATGLVFWLLDMPNPVLWGAGMAALNFIPYLGPAVVNAAVFAVAFVHYPTLVMALVPVGALMILNMIEGQFLTPMLIGSRSSTGSLAIFLAVAFGAWLWGAIGALLATPALIVGQTLLTARRDARRSPLLRRRGIAMRPGAV